MNTASKAVHVRFTAADYQRITTLAETAGKTATEIVRQIVEEKLNGEQLVTAVRQEIRLGVQELAKGQMALVDAAFNKIVSAAAAQRKGGVGK